MLKKPDLKIFVTAFLVCLCCSPVLGYQSVALGSKQGVNIYRLNLSPALPEFASIKYKSSLSTGLIVSYTLTERLHLNFEPSFTEKGAIYEIAVAPGWDEKTDYNLYCLSFPFIAKERILDLDLTPTLYAGFEFAYLLKATYGNEDITERFKDWDFGLIFGAGIEYLLDRKALFMLRFSYHLGVVDVLESGYSDYAFKNDGFEISLGIMGLYD